MISAFIIQLFTIIFKHPSHKLHPSIASLFSVAASVVHVYDRVATRPVFGRTSRFSACLSRVPV